MKQLEAASLWYNSLPARDRHLLLATGIFLAITLFYLIVWEPLHDGLELEQQKYKSQQDIHLWMQGAAREVTTLKRSGNKVTRSNQAITLILENSAKISGIKQYISKIESSGQNDARVVIDSVSFDQLLVWLNTLEQQHGVVATSVNIEDQEKAGTVGARLSFEKLQ